MTKAIVGIIGGSGVYHLPGLEDLREAHVATPWGEPSDVLHFGRIGGIEAVFLPRHGRGHRLAPEGINYRANIDALKQVGVTDLLSVSACGSFKQELDRPALFVIVDQFVDRTVGRPVLLLRQRLRRPRLHGAPGGAAPRQTAASRRRRRRRESAHRIAGGTYVCMEGPQFSSLAESLGYKAAGYDVIGMTAMPEAKLAREAETLLCHRRDGDGLRLLAPRPRRTSTSPPIIKPWCKANAGNAARLVARVLRDFPAEHEPCPDGSDRSLDTALITAPEARDPALMQKLSTIMRRVSDR